MSNSPPLGLRLGVEAGEVTLQDGTASNPIRLPFSEEAVNTPKVRAADRHSRRGVAENIGLDHLEHVSTFVADWVADTFGEIGR